MAMSKQAVSKRVKKLHEILDKIEQGKYTGIDISWVTSQIDWLWKFRYITEQEMNDLVGKAIAAMLIYKFY